MRIIILAILVIWGCQPLEKEQKEDLFERLFRGELNIIDLTHALNNQSPFWPNEENTNPFDYKALIQHPSGDVVLGQYETVEHYGTHLDAPVHFSDGGLTVDKIEIKDLFAPIAVVDVSDKCALNNDYRLKVEDLQNWENRNGPLPQRAMVLMYTGWSKKWNDPVAYRNQDEEGVMHFPGFSVEVNQWLLNERNIKGIGIDNLSVDYGMSKEFEAHLVTNGAGKYHLENVANMHLLPESGAYLIAAPIKIEGGSGGQVRIFAVLPE